MRRSKRLWDKLLVFDVMPMSGLPSKPSVSDKAVSKTPLFTDLICFSLADDSCGILDCNQNETNRHLIL